MIGVRIRRIVIQTMSFLGDWRGKTAVLQSRALAANADGFCYQQGHGNQVGQQGAAGE